MKKMRKENNKGFSLVEIIVVLVIMAILVAVSIPALTGYIEEAAGKGYLTEARTAYISAQACVSQICGADKTKDAATVAASLKGKEFTDNALPSEFRNLMKDSYTSGAVIKDISVSGMKISKLVYSVNGYEVTIEPGKTATVAKASS